MKRQHRREVMTFPDSDCWFWIGSMDGKGYGKYTRRGPDYQRGAHRVYWETFNGPVPEGMQLDHLCEEPTCVNPDHLEPVPQIVNLKREAASRRRRNGKQAA